MKQQNKPTDQLSHIVSRKKSPLGCTFIKVNNFFLQLVIVKNLMQKAVEDRRDPFFGFVWKARPARPPFQTVRFKPSCDDEWKKGKIVDKLPFRSYPVRVPDGSSFRRTSRHVRFSAEPPLVMDYSESSPTAQCKPPSSTTQPATTGVAAGNMTQSSTSSTPATPATNAQTPPTTTTRTRCGRAIVKPARYR